jgi:hypothetical protein
MRSVHLSQRPNCTKELLPKESSIHCGAKALKLWFMRVRVMQGESFGTATLPNFSSSGRATSARRSTWRWHACRRAKAVVLSSEVLWPAKEKLCNTP